MLSADSGACQSLMGIFNCVWSILFLGESILETGGGGGWVQDNASIVLRLWEWVGPRLWHNLDSI